MIINSLEEFNSELAKIYSDKRIRISARINITVEIYFKVTFLVSPNYSL